MRNSVHDIFIILSQQILNYKMLVAITSGQKSDFSSRFILIAFLFNEKKKKKVKECLSYKTIQPNRPLQIN